MKSIPCKVFIVLILLLMQSCSGGSGTDENAGGKLIIFHAGSLSVPFNELAEAFNKEHPGIEVVLEGAGSRECARKITELKKPCDIIASSDYRVITDLLIPEFTEWYVGFATNEMCIAYTADSRASDRIDGKNWYKVLLEDSIAYGRANPDLDPCGYRTLMTFQLSERYYNVPDLASGLANKDNEHIRPKEVDLLALLEARAIDYIFIYRSVAVQHDLKYLVLPDEINLKSPDLAGYYAEAAVSVSGKSPGENIVQKGEPMMYAVSIIKNAPNRPAAELFIEFLLTETKGKMIMEKNGQPGLSFTEQKYHLYLPDGIMEMVERQ